MDQKIVINQPLFYQETPFSTLYQLLSYEPAAEAWHVQNVVMGCEAPMIKDIDFTRISHNIKRFNTVQEPNVSEETLEVTQALDYLDGLGINTFKLMFGFDKETEVTDWSDFEASLPKREPALV